MKILMISDFYPPIIGGSYKHVQTLSRQLVKRNHQVVVCTIGSVYTKKIKEQFELKDIPVYQSPERAVKAMNILVERGKMHGC